MGAQNSIAREEAERNYKIASSAALDDFQAGRIPHAEWNVRQKKACADFSAAIAKAKGEQQ